MPSGDEIQTYLRACWSLMLGRREALRQLDLSADGFWNSFFAMIVALPALFVFWTSEAIQTAPGGFGERLGLVVRLALIEFVAWVLPLIVLVWMLYQLGNRDRVVAFVVANNWASALLAWVLLPFILLTTLVPGFSEIGAVLLLIVFVGILVLVWRLNDAVLGLGPATPTGIVLALVGLSLLIDSTLRSLLAIPSINQPL